ncbi:metal-dependent hydrolase [Rhodanobacter sp. FW510-R12]|uniref:M48 family metallopeptidase n=1 Tax=unclassified Rhodanobacter TaxID=2621553 RepID=UPI0007A9E273|nr:MULTISPECIES: SprT family zinc-dependent metalloprotease [unclassified Rhodanobacter]KZC15248.1 metal-dependent hydrolase [Rhodanobacter sp. FW104-R8]KZC26046.1 metal-dependent hydrolase [Rhodanobacter sp. FW510-T8]KZC32186.1 metal-dependent hydrolase [Rhodanobacter sp. FW510-R10]
MMQLVVKDLRFELRHSARRRTLQITVDRGGVLILSAPPDVGEARLRDFVQRKRMWVYRQLARQAAVSKPLPRKVFVDGEGFLYLGRSYRLRLVPDEASEAAVKLQLGRLLMPRALARDGRAHLLRWYVARAQPWLQRRVQDYAARMEVDPTGVRVQDLGYRWGSCGKGGRLYFHWKTILLPARIAEYVVVHEMAHLHEPHHTPEFWRRVERAMPDYELRKTWLAEHGMDVEGL